MTTRARVKQYRLEDQRRVCPASWCGSGAWLVQRDAHLQDVWQLTHPVDSGTWTVAATDPVCPRCGTTLELDGGSGVNDSLQPGALLDWVLTL